MMNLTDNDTVFLTQPTLNYRSRENSRIIRRFDGIFYSDNYDSNHSQLSSGVVRRYIRYNTSNIISSNNNVSKYKFFSCSEAICDICMENFKSSYTMCINSCFHYWCGNCNDKLKNNSCPFCKKFLEPNLFFDSKGDYGYFLNVPYCNKPFDIIKKDIESLDLDNEIEDLEQIDNTDDPINQID